MTYLHHLPSGIAHFVRTRFVAEFATISMAGIPIDTPLVPFTSEDLETMDAATGLAYPAKAERVRRNPKVGMLFEGAEDEPIVSIAGMAAVRDSDLQANLNRYLSEEILTPTIGPAFVDYETVTRQAIWYFTRIIICVKPVHVRWWSNQAATDGPPQTWRVPHGTVYPQSDPAPAGRPSKAPWDAAPPWQDIARSALARRVPAHLTLLDAEGFPLPVRARHVQAHAEGLRLILPRWLPWSGGKATVSFQGVETFIGEAHIAGTEAFVRIARALPIHPLMSDPSEILRPKPATKQALLERIQLELDRRGQPLPKMPARAPEPTAGAKLRAEDAFAFPGFGTMDDSAYPTTS